MFQDLHKLELRVLQKHTKEIEKQEKEKRLAKLREKVTFCFNQGCVQLGGLSIVSFH